VAVDDHSRVAFVQALSDERGPTCAQFVRAATQFFASEGITIERVMTDNALSYTKSRDFKNVLSDLQISHKRIRFRRPQTNGKAERFNRTLLEEFAYKTLFTTNEQRLGALGPWLNSYNSDRPHTAIGGLTPMQRLRQQR
jgi:transposase InsO family protein